MGVVVCIVSLGQAIAFAIYGNKFHMNLPLDSLSVATARHIRWVGLMTLVCLCTWTFHGLVVLIFNIPGVANALADSYGFIFPVLYFFTDIIPSAVMLYMFEKMFRQTMT